MQLRSQVENELCEDVRLVDQKYAHRGSITDHITILTYGQNPSLRYKFVHTVNCL